MAGWHHRLNGHEFGQTQGVGDGQVGLACCSSWGRKELDMTWRLNWDVILTREMDNMQFNTQTEFFCFWEDKQNQKYEQIRFRVSIKITLVYEKPTKMLL